MSFASLHLIDRESLELHHEGVAYGPIVHTEALGLLLFALRPAGVHCSTPRADVERAMRRVVAHAERTVRALEARVADGEDVATHVGTRHDGERTPVPSDESVARWLEAACLAAPGWHSLRLRETLAPCLRRTTPRPGTLH